MPSDVLAPYGKLDVLYYYREVAEALSGFLRGKELASKVWIPRGPRIIKRASKHGALYVEELLENVDEEFLKLRLRSLKEVRGNLNPVQVKIWNYFLPRKLCDFFYATNGEGEGKAIERIFFDIDRPSEVKPQEAQRAARALVELIRGDEEFNALVPGYRFFCMYTGSSFHVYLLLKDELPPGFYHEHLRFSKAEPLASFTGRWAEELRRRGIAISAGHEKLAGKLILDPSQTPSGKLARAPFSLHMHSARDIDGVALPLSEEMLAERNLIEELRSYTPEKVLDNLSELRRRIPL
jgi:DNA primase